MLVEPASELLAAGLSVIPADGQTKKPCVPWKPYIEDLPEAGRMADWFKNGASLAIICGPVSGNLEIIDFDEEGIAQKWAALLKSWNLGGLVKRLVIEKSQRRGGSHVGYRHQGQPDGNQKLARRGDRGEECLIETRGLGGYCLVAPSPGYSIKQGSWTDLPLISAEEREALLAAARMLDETPPQPRPHGSGRVGDDYNERASIDEILVPLGWQRDKQRWGGGEEYWTRPGKSHGTSATYNWKGLGLFRIFSSSVGLEPGAYDKFGLFARLWHNGDFRAAAKAAGESGYGRDPAEFVKHRYVESEQRVRMAVNGPRKWSTFAEIEAEEIEWLIEPYFPLGIGYVLLYGDSGIGKSTSLLSIIAALSRGEHPFTGKAVEPVKSIILSAEDSAKHVVKPRLYKMGANMKNILAPEEFLEDGTPNPLILDEDGASELMEQVVSFGAKLIMTDPLTAYYDGDSINDRLQARTWTRRLANIGITCNCCPVIVHHVSKPGISGQGRYRAAGSQDFFDAARSALMAVQSQAEPDDYALSHEKHNLTVRGDSLGYTFSKDKGFHWTGVSDLTSELAAHSVEEHISQSKVDLCAAWLLDQLEGGPMLASDVEKGFKRAVDCSLRTFRAAVAKVRDRVRSFQEPRGVPGAAWWYELRDIEGVYRGGD